MVLSNSFEPSDDPEFLHNDPEFLHDNIDTPEEIISHIFHKASIAILAILVVYVSVSAYGARDITIYPLRLFHIFQFAFHKYWLFMLVIFRNILTGTLKV